MLLQRAASPHPTSQNMTQSSPHDTRPFRSYLFVPATSERKLDKALTAETDALIVDLEDAVAVSEKPAARLFIAERLRQPLARPIFVRVNDLGTPFAFDDIAAVASPHLTGIVLPKVESAADIAIADWLLAQAERRLGLAAGSIGIIPILETARGLVEAASIAKASPRLRCMMFGMVDLAVDMELDLGDDEGAIQSARFAVALASRAAGLPGPVDTAFIDIADPERLRRSSAQARRMGYAGKSCIHPSQLAIVTEVFSPSAEEIARARRIVAAFEAAEADGVAALKVDGAMIDYPVVIRARRVLAHAG
jgi:citrate lyase subunit beta/citryl-CoA lyase